jgi:hypothetical protein
MNFSNVSQATSTFFTDQLSIGLGAFDSRFSIATDATRPPRYGKTKTDRTVPNLPFDLSGSSFICSTRIADLDRLYTVTKSSEPRAQELMVSARKLVEGAKLILRGLP